MSKELCSKCYYGGRCDHYDDCDDYISLEEHDDYSEDCNMIETNRMAFRAEWFEYIENCNS